MNYFSRKTVFLILILTGMILTVEYGWAQTNTNHVYGNFTYGGTADPEMWTDEAGITHLRNIPYELNSVTDSGNMEMTMQGVCHHNRDMVTGMGDFWGEDHSVSVSWNDKSGIFEGIHNGITHDSHGYGGHLYNGIEGDFVGWKLKLRSIFYFLSEPPKKGEVDGILYNPEESTIHEIPGSEVAGVWDMTMTFADFVWSGKVTLMREGIIQGLYDSTLSDQTSPVGGYYTCSEDDTIELSFTTKTQLPELGEITFVITHQGKVSDTNQQISGNVQFTVQNSDGVAKTFEGSSDITLLQKSSVHNWSVYQ
jgi:hypothetical protein